MNDVITGMLTVFEKNRMTGTVGARLHFEDNTIQHDGILMYINKIDNRIGVTHLNLRNYYNYSNSTKEVFGNTGGLMMVRKFTFEKYGMFNENYVSCFEDVEVNMTLLSSGFKNYICSECVSYHYESLTRNEDPKNLDKLNYDYHNNLLPSIKNNIDKIKNNIIII